MQDSMHDKGPLASKKFWGAIGITVALFGTMTLSGFWSLDLPPDVLSNLAFGVSGAWTSQVITQGIVDRERAKTAQKGAP